MSDLIEDGVAADKLARAILADITRYNSVIVANAVRPLETLAKEIGEGRALFRSRVTPALHPRFDVIASEWAETVASEPAAVEPPNAEDERLRGWRVAAAAEEERAADEAAEADAAKYNERRRQRVITIVGLALVAVAVAVGAVIASEHHHEREHDVKHEGH